MQTELENLIRANTFQFQIQNGTLSGDGEKLLISALNNVQFVAYGEEHNRRSVHQFGEALFRLLHDKYGFNYLALEEDPYWGKMLSDAARKGGSEEVIRLGIRYPNAFHLRYKDEMEMIGKIGKISSAKKQPIWGLNQVFGATHIYERLVEIAPNKTARDAAQNLLAQALEYEKERFQKNTNYISKIAKPEDFEKLRLAFKPAPNSEADFLITQIALSNRIYAPYVASPRPSSAVFYESGKMRETNMKQLFAERYRETQSTGDSLPKVMAMFGQLHLYRGLSENTEQYTFGNYLSELANFNGKQSFHIYSAIDSEYVYKSPYAPFARIASEITGKSASGAVIDLRPLFDYARNNKNMNPQMRRMIMSFDVFLFLKDGEQGSLKRLQTPNFHWYTE